MASPTYKWAFTEPFYPIFHIVTTSVSVLSNSILLYVIRTAKSDHIGAYRYLLAYFAICDMTTSLAHFIVQPYVHVTSSDLYFFPRYEGSEIFGVSIASCTTVFFSATYFQTFIVLSYHFLYRCRTVTSGLSKSFTDSWRVSHWLLAGSIVNIVYFGGFLIAVGFGLSPSEEKRKSAPAEILEIYGINLSNSRQALIMFSLRETDDQLNVKAIFALNICVVLFFSSTAVIIVCIYKTNALIRVVDSKMSQLRRRMQRQLFHALLIQTAIPCIFSYLPLAVLIPSGTVSGLSIGAFANILFMITAIFPAIDAFFVLFFIVKFRRAVIRLFKMPFSTEAGSSVENIRTH